MSSSDTFLGNQRTSGVAGGGGGRWKDRSECWAHREGIPGRSLPLHLWGWGLDVTQAQTAEQEAADPGQQGGTPGHMKSPQRTLLRHC